MKTLLKNLPIVLLVMLMLSIVPKVADACTGIRLIAENGQVVYGRTMEWGEFNLESRVAIIPRGLKYKGITPDGENGLAWKGKYGAVGLDMLKQEWLADAMNEKGLTVGMFYHPGYAKYPEYIKAKANISITAKQVSNFIVTQFATVDEVRKGMSEIMVVPVIEKALGIPIEAHWFITDATGKSIVIEFEAGEMKIYDNYIGVFTNAPYFPWHMTNLRNYVGLSPKPDDDMMIDSVELAPLGVGSGMIGVPGDFTPPSRFVRAVAWSSTARPLPNSEEAIYELFRILDNFNEPVTPPKPGATGLTSKGLRSATLWTTGWDISNLGFYYHTQNDRRVRYIDLKALDFSNMGNEVINLKLDEKDQEDIKDRTPYSLKKG